MNSPATPSLAYISIGPYSRLYSEDHFVDALAPLGMTRRSFRALCRVLSVPTLEIGKTRLIDRLSFALALRAALRIGQPDFLAPTSETLRKGRPLPPHCRTSLPASEYEALSTSLIAELLLAHRTTSLSSPTLLRAAAIEASRRMILAGLQSAPLAEQTAFTRKALRKATSEGFENATPHQPDPLDAGPVPPPRSRRRRSDPLH